jgi:TP901 family phage tail tape measure protein
MADALILEFKAKTDDLDKRLKGIEKGVTDTGKASKKVTADMGAQFKNLGGQIATAFGVTMGVAAFVSVMRGAFNAAKDFEAQMSKVRAISGATNEQMVKLETSAKALGASTMFTATQVGQLQEEYARLGFTTKEILAATAATLDLAAATGETLAASAQVAGSTVRGFGLDASETTRVADVMALSFSKSALNLSDFAEGMKLVAPIARAANIPLETATALLGKLADSGLRGSIAGTALKNLLSKLADGNSDLSKELGFSVKNTEDLYRAFQELAKGNIDLTKATELTDERSKAAFITLLNGIDSVETLKTALDGAAGSAKTMAETMQNNLAGSITKLSSAWEGFTNQMLGSQGALKSVVDLLTQSVQGWGIILSRMGGETAEQAEKMKMGFELVKGATAAATRELEKYVKPLEAAGDTAAAQAKANELYAAATDKLTLRQKQQKEVVTSLVKAEGDLKDLVSDSLGFDKVRINAKEEEIDKLKLRKIAADTEVESLEAVIGVYERYIEVLNGAADANEEVSQISVRSISLLSNELKTLKDELQNAEIGSKGFWDVLFRIQTKIKELSDAQAMVNLAEDLTPDVDDTSSQDAKIQAEAKRESDRYKALQKLREDHQNALDESIRDEIAAELDRINQIEEAEKAARDRQMAARQAMFDENIANSQMFLQTVMDINSTITNAVIAGHDAEIRSLENQLQAGQISREQFDKKRRELERKKAADAKTAAIFNAVIGTALAVVNAIALGPPQGYILAAISAALGAVEIGVIASQPLPQFAKGVIGLQGEGTETSDSIHARLSRGESVMTAKETRQHRPILEAIRKGTLERMIAETYVRPAVDSAMLSGFSDMGRSADLNGLTAKLSDHNIIAAMDRNRSATVYGLKMLADKLDKRAPKRGGYA